MPKIKEIEYDPNHETQNMCSIYCTPFENGEIVCKLPCNHIFSKTGIYKWFNENNQCPICRFELDYKEVKIETDERLSNQTNLTTNLQSNNTHNDVIYYNRYPSFNLINILIQQEEIEYQQAIIRSLSDN